ncbi:MAG TPA: tetratricopeptide repeat protein [Longimicrobium sp.]|nr:tetratricopeptide repeat protein [Longimicrobium sp.]
MEELEVLRLQLMGAAVPDPQRTWDSSSSYTTIDKRILPPEAVERAIAQAEQAVLQHITQLHEGLRPVFRSFFAGQTEEAARGLITLGERHEASGRAVGAYQCYRAALTVSLPLLEKGLQILALRRLGRVALALGDFKEATAFYGRSADLARDSDDLRSEVIALTGGGNVSMYQGRWAEAEKVYRQALALAEGEAGASLQLERGQLFNNMGNVSTRTGRLEEADEWLERAAAFWKTVDSPVDLAVCYINLGHLREAQGRLGDARAVYHAGMDLPIPPSIKAILAADAADACLLEGYLTEAEEFARVAEEHAIASRSPYTLGHTYRHLGNLARARCDEDGFTFYEKSLEIAREKRYPFLEAETLTSYAEMRRQNGGTEEAQAYLERACEIFRNLGAVRDLARAEAALAELRTAVLNSSPPPEPEEPEQPLALSGD